LYFDPAAKPDPDREHRLKGVAGRIELRPAERAAWLGMRSLACPECGVPIRISAPVSWHEYISCAFCEAEAPTHEFIRDQGWPEVDLIARVR
jgi:hypothetical protein